jgi:hypothetical protein
MTTPARAGLLGQDRGDPFSEKHWEQLRALSLGSYRFVLPRGWEVSAYLIAHERGQLQFQRRDAFVAQLDWRVVTATPDQPRIMRAIDARCGESGRATDGDTLHTVARGAWLIGEGGGRRMHASLFQSSTGVLLHWTFASSGHENGVGPHELLDSYAPNHGAPRPFELFGVRVQLPSTCAFVRVRAEPCDVSVQWTVGTTGHLQARRMGMDRVILGDRSLASLAALLLHRDGARVERTEERPWLGLPGVRATFSRRAERGLDTLVGRPHQGEAQLWHDQDEGRIYALTQWGRGHDGRVPFEGMWGPPAATSDAGARA